MPGDNISLKHNLQPQESQRFMLPAPVSTGHSKCVTLIVALDVQISTCHQHKIVRCRTAADDYDRADLTRLCLHALNVRPRLGPLPVAYNYLVL